MKTLLVILQLVLVLAIALSAAQPAGAKEKTTSYRTGLTRWRAADGGFAGWSLSGVQLTVNGSLQFDPSGAEAGSDPAGAYNQKNFYNGGDYFVGEATGPETATPFAFTQAIASWNAVTPAGTWIETQMRARIAGRWSKWYNLGVWASDGSTVERHSVSAQGDTDGYVSVDTLVLSAKKSPGAEAFQVKLRLFSADGVAAPTVRNLFAAYSESAPTKAPSPSTGNPALWNTLLNVPECSQMVYPDGGEVWCSPTSTSMVLAYWQNDTGPCEPRVRAAVDGVFDWIYDGHGNWPFNTAYAATKAANNIPLEGYVTRFASLDEVEPWVAAGVPVIVSFAWGKGDLTGAAIPSSNGHLAVLVGFDAAGNPIVNDPAAAADADVQRTYDRSEFEAVWLTSSGGSVYLIHPQGWNTPN